MGDVGAIHLKCSRVRVRARSKAHLHYRRPRPAALFIAFVVAFTTTSCSSPSPISTGVDRSLPPGTYAAQEAVLKAWINGERQYYAYMDEPLAPLRQQLLAGVSPARLFSKVALYATGASLATEIHTLTQMKLQELSGPKSFNLGRPKITSFRSRHAVVSSCVYDSGTTTASGKPGPLTLDGGPGGAEGVSDFEVSRGRWKAYSGTSTSVSKC